MYRLIQQDTIRFNKLEDRFYDIVEKSDRLKDREDFLEYLREKTGYF